MDNIKVTSLLKTLNKSEIEKFSSFLKTPLFNERETLSKLFEEIKKFYPEFSGSSFTKENLYKNLYKNKSYNDELMRNLISRLYNKLEKFLSFLNYEKDTFNQQYGLMLELNNRSQEKLFKKKFDSVKKVNEENLLIDTETYFREHRLALLQSSHYFKFMHTPVTEKDILIKRENKLTEYFLSDILNVYAMMANQLSLYPERDYKFSMLDEIINYTDKNSEILENNFYLQICLNCVMLSLKQKDENYFKLRKLLNENGNKLSRSEKGEIYIVLHNYLQEKIFKGDVNSIRERFELFKESFANEGAYYDDGTIMHNELILAVSNALMLKEIPAASDFIDKYGNEVAEYYKESTKYYCLALIDYYKKDYSEALKKLSHVHHDDLSYKIHVRTLMLMIYFSMNEFEGFYSLADSYKHFLNESLSNKKVSEYYHTLYLNLINYASRLFKGKEELDKFDLRSFRKELIESPYIAKKQWLLEMVDELK